MVLKHLTVQRFLSFDHDGIALDFRDLNVLIGPNGSGKSNLLEVLAVLKSMPTHFGARFRLPGSEKEWSWSAAGAAGPCVFKVHVNDPRIGVEIMHVINFGMRGEGFSISFESIRVSDSNSAGPNGEVYEFEGDAFKLWDSRGRVETSSSLNLKSTESILSQVRDPQGTYLYLRRLDSAYTSFWLHRTWEFGPNSAIRRPQPTDARADHLTNDGLNLPVIVSQMIGGVKRELAEHMRAFMADVQSIDTVVRDNAAQVYLDEGNGREIPASRLSDGTLRYLGLLAILLDPNPPALVAIEEPELGLHPDVLPGLGKLIKEASSRMQIFITTHSQILLDAFSEDPEDVIVCSRGATGSKMERLNKEKLDGWLKDHTLGELWNMGEIGGNRW